MALFTYDNEISLPANMEDLPVCLGRLIKWMFLGLNTVEQENVSKNVLQFLSISAHDQILSNCLCKLPSIKEILSGSEPLFVIIVVL